jgi:hypothetical protein
MCIQESEEIDEMTLTENDDILVPPSTSNSECTEVDENLLNREQKWFLNVAKHIFG